MRTRWIALTLGGLLCLLLLGWWQRRPIAARFVDRALAARGVEGRYRIEAMGVFTQRLAGLSLGDPARPDLVARSVELRLAWGVTGPRLAAVTARGVRLRGALRDGRLSFGAVDRLLSPGGGGGFALPAIDLDVADAALSLATPAGPIGIAVEGSGRLDDGWRGRVAAAAPRVAARGCAGEGVRAGLAVHVARRAPRLDGPIRAARIACGGAAADGVGAMLHATFAPGLDGWSGTADLAADTLAIPAGAVRALAGAVSFAGTAARTEGTMRIAGRALRARPVTAAGLALAGRYAIAGTPVFDGEVRLSGARLDPSATAALPRLAATAAGTPPGPLATALAAAAVRAAAAFGGAATVAYGPAGASLGRASLTSASGARLRFEGRATPAGAAGTVTMAGGGLPAVRAVFGHAGGTATVAPYIAGGARVAPTPVRFAFRPGGLSFATTVTLDGPLPGGGVAGLTLPLAGHVDRSGIVLRDACLPLAAERILVAGFDFRGSRMLACLRADGVRVAAVRLTGTSGAQPATLAIDDLRYAGGGFSTGAATLAIADTRLSLDRAAGRAGPGGLEGTVAGLGGRIAAVPLAVTPGAGRWVLAGGRLTLATTARVADTAPQPRFAPLAADDLRLALANGRIDAAATLRDPATGVAVTAVAIRHDLGAGTGAATLTVPGLTFDDTLQPEALTPLTLGVVANVRGTVKGRGEIAWGPAGVTSTGDFSTDGIDLAAAFGPVTGISGTIRFSDLLALATPLGQEVAIAGANPGIAVADGRVRFGLLPGRRVRIEGGRWPFAGGRLLLEPATIDFSRPNDRRLAFRIDGLDAARFVEQLAFENIAATGIFDGTMPMMFDEQGGRIEGGHLTARPGGGTVAYVGELTRAQLGTWGKLAFDALKSIRYRALTVALDGALDGEIVSRVSFAGVNQAPIAGTKTPFRRELKGLPFVFNITVRAPFRGLLGSARSFADPGLLLRERLAVQPAASGTAP